MSDPPPSYWIAFVYCIPLFAPMAWPRVLIQYTSCRWTGCMIVINLLLFGPPLLFHFFLLPHHIQTALQGVWFSLLWIYLVQPLRAAKSKVENYIHHRQDAFREAVERFKQQQQEEGRIQRHELYDLYLPPKTKDSYEHALLFIPGALVDRTAYSIVMSNLSEKNIIVAVLNLEPMRLPMNHLGANYKKVQYIMDHIQETVVDSPLSHLTWTLGGHSMGGYTASECIMKLNNNKKHIKLVMWSGGPVCKAFSKNDLPMLSIIASNDRIASQQKKENLPKSVRITTITGGNHSGFGHYGPQTFPHTDGERTILLEEQQKQVVDATASFICNDSSQ